MKCSPIRVEKYENVLGENAPRAEGIRPRLINRVVKNGHVFAVVLNFELARKRKLLQFQPIRIFKFLKGFSFSLPSKIC
jgi:hypothetical protein